MFPRAKRSTAIAVAGSLAIATAALAAQPAGTGVYVYSTVSGTHQTGVIMTMEGKHHMNFELDCGATGITVSPVHPGYIWAWPDVPIKSNGSFSYHGRALGMALTHTKRAGGRKFAITLHGNLNVSGRFTSSTLATGTAKAGKCTAHFRATRGWEASDTR